MQGPGPPQRPQVRGESDEGDAAVELTAKTLSRRAVFVEPHFGHAIFSPALIERTSFSNDSLHASHWYS